MLGPQEHARKERVFGSMPRRTNNRWTPEEDAALRELAAQGKTRLQIALRLRRTKDAVKDRATLLGIKFPPGKPSPRRAA